jgi:hypothetical protein
MFLTYGERTFVNQFWKCKAQRLHHDSFEHRKIINVVHKFANINFLEIYNFVIISTKFFIHKNHVKLKLKNF